MALFLLVLLFIMSNLKLSSYNCNGHSPDKIRYIKSLAQTHDFVLLQEHWLMDRQLDIFPRNIENIRVHGVSGMPDNLLLTGRPYGGCAIIWSNSLTYSVTPIECVSRRLCAVLVHSSHAKFLLFNVYMPCDSN